MLEGKNVNLRVCEKEDLPLVAEWLNDPEFLGIFGPLRQQSKMKLEKRYDKLTEENWFIIEKKDGSKIGEIGHGEWGGEKRIEIGYFLVPSERRKGYCTEAVKILVDYLFLSKDIARIQAHTDVRNVASQKVLEKNGFKKEGVIRKSLFIRGKWRDRYLYSILIEEWKEPKILIASQS